MVDLRYSRPKHLLAAVPVASFVGALVMVLGMGAKEPLAEFVFAVPTAAFVALYILPFAGIGALVAYFALRRIRLLSAVPCALVGLGIGLAVAAADPKEPLWMILCAVVGVVSALAGYWVLWRLARPPAPNSPIERDARKNGARPSL